ncbi:MAG: hypothetical protein M1817_005026 [Caeruleum heppii]|nr:MAG: hypothetical protein M1817_005026 [Caeruleum heppii]
MTPSLAPPTKRKASALSDAPPPSNISAAEDEEDDYLSMAIHEPIQPLQKETYTARRLRLAREAEAKQPKSRAERDAAARLAREEALNKPLHEAQPQSKGLKMMRRMGFQEGGALGKPSADPSGEEPETDPNAGPRTEPIGISIKDDRGGIGLDAEKARIFRQQVAGVEQKAREEVDGYRERVARDREEKRLEGLWWGAMGVAEGLEEDRDDGAGDETTAEGSKEERKMRLERRPLAQVPLLWRALKRRRLEQRQAYRERHSLPSLSAGGGSRPHSHLPSEDHDDDPSTFSTSLRPLTTLSPPSSSPSSPGSPQRNNNHLSDALLAEAELDDADPELDAYLQIPIAERLDELLRELRRRWWYCFWCKAGFEEESMEGCPGWGEDVHG